ncbi:MAG: hypothetical protein ACRCX2_24050 [Paraclostridium sp.]
MEFKIRNRNAQILRHAPSRNNIEDNAGNEHSPNMESTLSRLKSQYRYVEFFKLNILDAQKRAKAYGMTGLIVSAVDGDFVVLDRFGIPFENTIEFRSIDSSIKNQSKKHNLSADGKLAVALGNKRQENFNLMAMGIKMKRDKCGFAYPERCE